MPAILLATDGSEDAHRAAEYAIELARERDAVLHVLCVVDRRTLDEPALGSEELATILVEDSCRTAIETIRDMASRAGVAMEWRSEHGLPHQSIHEHARDIDADQIVVGHHGSQGEHLGGVRRRLIELTDREVVIPPAFESDTQ
ncbi:universal stress protein [Haloglomus litoreum]|uniref:universal stress protein n=1 Tax=Haloglomus litoreum TaxID=3034026 RepID=UPI0023E873DF|nr:universal stress protein [Haloglomus sp. DT116]